MDRYQYLAYPPPSPEYVDFKDTHVVHRLLVSTIPSLG
jgi:hypothetical protein